jgi:hypothetical protein
MCTVAIEFKICFNNLFAFAFFVLKLILAAKAATKSNKKCCVSLSPKKMPSSKVFGQISLRQTFLVLYNNTFINGIILH